MVDPSDLEPDRIARREFTTTFRGFDQAEVRSFLDAVSRRLAEVVAGERDLRARLDRSEARPADLDQIDEHRLTELLGEETARIFEAAREAAAEIRAKAESKTAQLVREAKDEANRMTSEAAELLRLRSTEAETAAATILSDAEAERDRILSEANAEAEAMRVQASADASQVRDEAQRVRDQAEAEVADAIEAARQQGRDMVAEAQIVRERILKDLARRRRSGKAQLEQLRAARERLLDAYALVRRTLEEATAELSVVVPEAKLAAEAAGRRVEADDDELSVEAIEAELDAGRVAGVPLLDTGEVPVTRVAGPEPDVSEPESEPLVAAEPDVAEPESEPEPEPEPATGDEPEPEPATAAGPEPEPDVAEPDVAEPDVAEPDVAEPDATPAVAAESEREPATADGPEPEPEHDDALPERVLSLVPELEDAPDELSEPDALPQAEAEAEGDGARVDELFARLRSEVPEVVDDAEGEPETPEVPDSAPALDAVAGAMSNGAPDVVDGGAPGELSEDPDEVALERRDRYVADLERDLARMLKRHLADDENDKLDLIRRRPARTVAVDVLPTLEVHRLPFVEAVTDTLAQAASSGRELAVELLAAGDEPSEVVIDLDVAIDDLAVELADSLLMPIRDRVGELVGGSEADDAIDGVRACYRRWRATIADLAAQYVHTAFNRGVYAAVPEGSMVRWVVDQGAGPCPDGEDDALEGPIPRGALFPTGHLHPPAHPGCRCLLVPGVL